MLNSHLNTVSRCEIGTLLHNWRAALRIFANQTAHINYDICIGVPISHLLTVFKCLHQRPRNWRQVRQAEPIFLTKQPQGNQLGTDQATQIQDVDNKGR